jgi:hypothetical protein
MKTIHYMTYMTYTDHFTPIITLVVVVYNVVGFVLM